MAKSSPEKSRREKAKEAVDKIREADNLSRTASSRAGKVKAAIKKIRAFHELGLNLPSKQKHKDGYRQKLIESEEERLQVNQDTLRKARKFADSEDGYTQQELDELCKFIQTVQPDQEEDLAIFGKTHVIRLLSVRPKQKRAALQKKCIKKGWSTAEVEDEIAKECGTRRQGGRRRRVPRDPAGLLTQLEGMCEEWRRWHNSLLKEEVTLPSKLKASVETVCGEVLSLQEKVLAALHKIHPDRQLRDLSEDDAEEQNK